MYQFFVESGQIGEDSVMIEGSDVNHIKNVLRMKPGEKIRISGPAGENYFCEIAEIEDSFVRASILEKDETGTELPNRIYLFQGLPKNDKMELIIQKAVELGVYEIVPVMMKRCVVKLGDEKKIQKKQERWQAIAEAAAKQSKRRIVPEVGAVCTLKEALEQTKQMDLKLIRYELSEGMMRTRKLIESAAPGQEIGVFIGPEGGFEEQEIGQARNAGAVPVTLGRRILRTETAGITTLSILMYHLECAEVQ